MNTDMREHLGYPDRRHQMTSDLHEGLLVPEARPEDVAVWLGGRQFKIRASFAKLHRQTSKLSVYFFDVFLICHGRRDDNQDIHDITHY